MRPWYGFFLSLTTAFMWGVLPIFLHLLLDDVDALTITWIRFLVAALLVFFFLLRSRDLPSLAAVGMRAGILLVVAVVALTGNFVLYLESLDRVDPETAQVVIQLAPFILMGGSVVFYGEPFGRFEWLGAALLLSGLLLFFNERLGDLFRSLSDYTLGVLFMVGAALSWSVYGLLQKTLLRRLNSRQLTLLIYCGGTILLTVVATPSALIGLDALQFGALLFSCLNTVVAYGAFTEAIHYWQAARVSAVIALAPLITILAMKVAVAFWPTHFVDSELNMLAYAGALLVVGGSMMASVGRRA